MKNPNQQRLGLDLARHVAPEVRQDARANLLMLDVILLEMEQYRLRTATEAAPGCPDFIIRYCQAIVARHAGYTDRRDWSNIQEKAQKGNLP